MQSNDRNWTSHIPPHLFSEPHPPDDRPVGNMPDAWQQTWFLGESCRCPVPIAAGGCCKRLNVGFCFNAYPETAAPCPGGFLCDECEHSCDIHGCSCVCVCNPRRQLWGPPLAPHPRNHWGAWIILPKSLAQVSRDRWAGIIPPCPRTSHSNPSEQSTWLAVADGEILETDPVEAGNHTLRHAPPPSAEEQRTRADWKAFQSEQPPAVQPQATRGIDSNRPGGGAGGDIGGGDNIDGRGANDSGPSRHRYANSYGGGGRSDRTICGVEGAAGGSTDEQLGSVETDRPGSEDAPAWAICLQAHSRSVSLATSNITAFARQHRKRFDARASADDNWPIDQIESGTTHLFVTILRLADYANIPHVRNDLPPCQMVASFLQGLTCVDAGDVAWAAHTASCSISDEVDVAAFNRLDDLLFSASRWLQSGGAEYEWAVDRAVRDWNEECIHQGVHSSFLPEVSHAMVRTLGAIARSTLLSNPRQQGRSAYTDSAAELQRLKGHTRDLALQMAAEQHATWLAANAQQLQDVMDEGLCSPDELGHRSPSPPSGGYDAASRPSEMPDDDSNDSASERGPGEALDDQYAGDGPPAGEDEFAQSLPSSPQASAARVFKEVFCPSL